MKRVRHIVLALVGCLASATLSAADLAGYWQHEEEPAWIEIRFEDGVGTGTVRRNDTYPDRVGRILLRALEAGEEADSWRGQVYAERFEEYKNAEISLPEPDQMQIRVKVGFMSRTITWTRAAALPAD